MLLPDVNVWLALTFDSHVHHPTAKMWFDGLASDVCYFCRLTQQGFLRLVTNPAVFGIRAVTLREAWGQYELYLSDPRVAFADEPATIEQHWRAFSQTESFSPHVWNDAYLAAFALAGGFQLVTFDRGFSKFTGANCMILP